MAWIDFFEIHLQDKNLKLILAPSAVTSYKHMKKDSSRLLSMNLLSLDLAAVLMRDHVFLLVLDLIRLEFLVLDLMRLSSM